MSESDTHQSELLKLAHEDSYPNERRWKLVMFHRHTIPSVMAHEDSVTKMWSALEDAQIDRLEYDYNVSMC
ncbi:hypothetical protein BGW80DRAFT_1390401 [Lactifluus volemus]|nr:hypothetical protein BGW80DRAFT_1390401 [Lactifluus volemus]